MKNEITPSSKKSYARNKTPKAVIKIAYVNELQAGLFEKAIANIYSKKVKNSKLTIK